MQYGCLKLIHFSKKSGRLSSAGSEILTFGSHCSANFQPILDCFIPKLKLENDDLEHIKIDLVNAVIFNLHQIKRFKVFFWDTRYKVSIKFWLTNFPKFNTLLNSDNILETLQRQS